MTNASERFPRAKLFAFAAELQSKIEFWQGTTSQKIDEAEDLGLGTVASKLNQRYQQLETARALITEARQALYECP